LQVGGDADFHQRLQFEREDIKNARMHTIRRVDNPATFMLARVIALLLLLAGAAHAVFAQTDIYILAGQSNMMGMAPLSGEPTPQNQGRLMMYTSTGEWLPAKDPLSAYAIAGMGPGLWFADRMATLCPGVTVGVIMSAIGGTTLSEWMPDYSFHTPYGNMIAKARRASAYGRIRGFLWYQGEAETTDPNTVLAYTQRMHVLFSAVRRDLGIPDLPIIFVQLGPGPNDGSRPYWHDIQVYQQYIADA